MLLLTVVLVQEAQYPLSVICVWAFAVNVTCSCSNFVK